MITPWKSQPKAVASYADIINMKEAARNHWCSIERDICLSLDVPIPLDTILQYERQTYISVVCSTCTGVQATPTHTTTRAMGTNATTHTPL